MDYDDQMVFALQILRAVPAVLAHFQDRYRYFCVDESQDTSKIQHEIIRLLAQKSRNLFMVGDEDQSIYGFRAAYPQALMEFEKVWPGARVLLMEQNYRSGSEIVDAANRFVARNRYRRPKKMRPTCGDQGPLEVVRIARREDQVDWLSQRVQAGERLTVLFRNNESALPLIDLCERSDLPYRFRKSDLTFFTGQDRPGCDGLFPAGRTPSGQRRISCGCTINSACPLPSGRRCMPAPRAAAPASLWWRRCCRIPP